MAKWLRLEDAYRRAVELRDAGAMLELSWAAQGDETAGRIYVSDTLDRYKVFYTQVSRDKRGRTTTRQRTRTFPPLPT